MKEGKNKMINFNYYNPAEIIFGRRSEEKIKDKLEENKVTSLLMIYSGDFVKTLGIFDKVEGACKELGINFIECGKVVPNPKIELVRELVTITKENKCDFVLAVGGGSAIDTAKAVALGALHDGDAWDFFDGKANVERALPIGVISTIPASGSETSNASIISNGLYKCGVEDNLIIPKFAIMNPEFTMGLPKFQTSAGISDIVSHLLERYFTTTTHVDTTDYLIEGALKALLLNGERVNSNPKDFDARAEIMWLATIAHNNLLDTGRMSDWASHRIEHELSAQYEITHGEGMAVVIPAYIRYMADILPEKMAQLANRVFDIDYNNYSYKEMCLKLADKLEEYYISLGLRTHLRQFDIDESNFELMANRATKNNTNTIGHYKALGVEEFIDILKLSL